MPSPFFLSYARDDRDNHLDAFFTDLSHQVRILAGSAVGEGFIDRDEIREGEEWREPLVEAINTSHSLVCLFTPTYFTRPYCGKEMQVFLERRRRFSQDRAGKKPSYVIPVYWQPCLEIPRTIPDFKPAAPDSSGYDLREHGLWYLRHTGEIQDYNRVVWRVALRVRDILSCPGLPPLPYTPLIDGIHNAFDLASRLPDLDDARFSGPDTVTFVYPARPDPSEWPFAPPDRQAAIRQAASIATGREMRIQSIEFDPAQPGLLERVQQASERKTVIILMVNGPALTDDALRQCLRRLDDQRIERMSTVVVWSGLPREQEIAEAFPQARRRNTPYFWGSINSLVNLSRAVSESLDRLRMDISFHGGSDEGPIAGSAPAAPMPTF